jgi:nicotinate-nucleotide adenylyltransferase
MQRIGIYSGTFDPIHQGHISFAKNALEACQLDAVFFAPEPEPRSKRNVTSLRHRLAMIDKIAEPQLKRLRLSSKQFTVRETLPELQRLFPNSRLVFLLGSDVVKSLPYWSDIETLLEKVELVIGLRDTEPATAIDELFATLPNATYTTLASEHTTAASSLIRSGDHSATPAAIRNYITQYELYAK